MPERVRVGTEVTWPGGVGVVDLLITAGEVPGVDQQVRGTKAAPVARVRTTGGERVAVPVTDLSPLPPVAPQVTPTPLVEVVRARGARSWPGPEVTSLSRDQWATQRVEAFKAAAAGAAPEGYHGDDDLLPGTPSW